MQFETKERLYHLILDKQQTDFPYKNQIIRSLMVTLLLKIKEYFFRDYNPIYEGNRSSQIVSTFKLNLENHLKELISGKVEKQLRALDYAEMQALHVNYLSNVINTKTGKTISKWIVDKMISETRVLLQNTQLSIKEIGHRGVTVNSIIPFAVDHSGIFADPVAYPELR